MSDTRQPEQIHFLRRFYELCIPYKGIQRRNKNVVQPRSTDKTVLRRALPGWQILFIAIGGVIGVTIFSTQGEILRLAGPAGLMMASLFVAVTMICVMECIGELVILWPVSNAMVEYVRVFVDRDLAIVIGIAYWYTMSCVFATLIIVASDFASYTIASNVGRDILFYGVIPVVLLVINSLGVEYYGFVEGIAGIVKILMVLSGLIYMIVESPKAGVTNFDDGFESESSVATGKFEAVCIAIPLISYGYIGTEIVAVTAFEAIDRKSLRSPARFVSYIVSAFYLVSAVLQCFLINYTDNNLQKIDANNEDHPLVKRADSSAPNFYPVIVVAARHYTSNVLGWYFNGCIIYFCISAANTALYVASRTLFGLTRNLNTKASSAPWFLRPLRCFGITSATRQVPLFSLLLSTFAFYWLIPLQTSSGLQITDMLQIMGTTASIGGIIVWASQCVAFIRYYWWLRKFRDLGVLPPAFNRWEPNRVYSWHRHRTLLADLRLIPAVIGFIGCFCIIFVLSTASWWRSEPVTMKELLTAYAGPMILTFVFLVLKLWNRRWYVKLPVDTEVLANITGNLDRNSNLLYVPHGLPQTINDHGDSDGLARDTGLQGSDEVGDK